MLLSRQVIYKEIRTGNLPKVHGGEKIGFKELKGRNESDLRKKMVKVMKLWVQGTSTKH